MKKFQQASETEDLLDELLEGIDLNQQAEEEEAVEAQKVEEAKEKAYGEYDKFRLIQDREYLSDFDKEVRNWKELGLFDNENKR